MKVKEIQCYGDVPREINNWNIPIPTLDYTFIIRLTYQRLVPESCFFVVGVPRVFVIEDEPSGARTHDTKERRLLTKRKIPNKK